MFPCVCCGYLTLAEPPKSWEICEICFWEDDVVQLRYPSAPVGGNHVSLVEAQRNFAQIGAAEERILKHVRPPTDADKNEPGWRPIGLEIYRFEKFPLKLGESVGQTYFNEIPGDPARSENRAYPDDLTRLYWWRPTFWNPLVMRHESSKADDGPA